MEEQPTGYIATNKALLPDEIDQAQQALQALTADYDGSVPFPEYVEQYMQAHTDIPYDFRLIAQYVIPPNDPRNKKHDGTLSSIARAGWIESGDIVFVHAGISDVFLNPRETLSLLDWLTQERPTLERMAQEHNP